MPKLTIVRTYTEIMASWVRLSAAPQLAHPKPSIGAFIIQSQSDLDVDTEFGSTEEAILYHYTADMGKVVVVLLGLIASICCCCVVIISIPVTIIMVTVEVIRKPKKKKKSLAVSTVVFSTTSDSAHKFKTQQYNLNYPQPLYIHSEAPYPHPQFDPNLPQPGPVQHGEYLPTRQAYPPSYPQ